MWLTAFCALGAGLGRVDDRVEAVALVLPPRLRQAPRLAVVYTLMFVAATVLPLVLIAVVPALRVPLAVGPVLLLAPPAKATWASPHATRRLQQLRPGGAWVVAGVASSRRGAGRELLEEVCAEADALGRTLCFNAAAELLVNYCRRLGFEVSGPAEQTAWGTLTPMFRCPRRSRPQRPPPHSSVEPA